ncbi:MAG: class I SAM-dependent methyltransferase [Phycisphaerales bacterium]
MKNYDQQFFADRDDRTRYAAQRVLDITLEILPPINSCIDIGCGVGTWLRVLADRGVDDVVGAEGDWLDTSLLMIDQDRFMRIDLRRPVEIGRRFDMAISLEVAEHITPEEGDRLVGTLTEAADFVPIDAIRPRIWDDDRVAVWYRQNTILYVRGTRLDELAQGTTAADPGTLSMVHPELYTRRLLRAHSLGGGVKSALRSLGGGGRAVRTLRRAEPPTK